MSEEWLVSDLSGLSDWAFMKIYLYPPAVSKDQVRPSPIAIQERKKREEAARRRRTAVFHR